MKNLQDIIGEMKGEEIEVIFSRLQENFQNGEIPQPSAWSLFKYSALSFLMQEVSQEVIIRAVIGAIIVPPFLYFIF